MIVSSTYIFPIIDFDNTKNVLFTLCPYDVRTLEGMKHKYILGEIMHIQLRAHISLNYIDLTEIYKPKNKKWKIILAGEPAGRFSSFLGEHITQVTRQVFYFLLYMQLVDTLHFDVNFFSRGFYRAGLFFPLQVVVRTGQESSNGTIRMVRLYLYFIFMDNFLFHPMITLC